MDPHTSSVGEGGGTRTTDPCSLPASPESISICPENSSSPLNTPNQRQRQLLPPQQLSLPQSQTKSHDHQQQEKGKSQEPPPQENETSAESELPDMVQLSLADCKEFLNDIFNGTPTNNGATIHPEDHPEQSEECSLVSLRMWIMNKDNDGGPQTANRRTQEAKEHLVRKATVAYGITEILRHSHRLEHFSLDPQRFQLDNFAVLLSSVGAADADSQSCRWNNIQGVVMISPSINLRFAKPLLVSENFFDEVEEENEGSQQLPADPYDDLDGLDGLGTHLQVEIDVGGGFILGEDGSMNNHQKKRGDGFWCHTLGVILHELFANEPPFSCNVNLYDSIQEDIPTKGREDDERCTKRPNSEMAGRSKLEYVPLLKLGLPSSISMFVKSLIDCTKADEEGSPIGCQDKGGFPRPYDAYPSLGAASNDLHLLLQYPNRFLFDNTVVATGDTISVGSGLLHLRKHRLYGRHSQMSLLADTYCRVSLTGQSEGVFVSGYSGSGKTKLVESVMEHVALAGGYVIDQKCDQMQQERPLSVIISALNKLPLLILQTNTPQEVELIVEKFTAVFGHNISTLARVLPNITLLIPQLNEGRAHYSENELNFHNLHFLLLLFMRVVSSKERPVMLFLDDLHWSCTAALDLILAILSDRQGSNCLFFVGSYRDDEVRSDHAICGFTDKLSSLNVPAAIVHLDGMTIDELNRLVSDALCLLPNCCRRLSQILYQKTKGNPHFAVSVMRSLVERGLIRYSVRVRRRVWDESKIRDDEGISNNVLHLLSTKMAGMPEIQSALKIASCFGARFSADVVKFLSCVPEYTDIERHLDDVISEGFMELSRADYKFVHDSVQESAYNLIPAEEKNQFHYRLGISIYNNTPAECITNDLIFLITDQINHGNPSLIPPMQLINVAGLNYAAAKISMSSSNFTAARFYLGAAINLLPDGHWSAHYDLSKNLFFLIGNAALAAGHMTEASDAVNVLICNGRCLEDKLGAYHILVLLLHAQNKPKQAYSICLDVLSQLGEEIPASVYLEESISRVCNIQTALANKSNDYLLNMKVMESKTKLSLMQFYSQIHFISYFLKPDSGMMHFYACRLIELCLEYGISKYSARAFNHFAMILGGNTVKDTDGSYRMGKLALQFLSKFNAIDQLPIVYLQYYGYIAVHREPFQACAEMLRQAHEIGLSIGDIPTAVLNGIHYIQKALIAGQKLSVLKEDAAYQGRVIDRHSLLKMSQSYLKNFQETVNALMTKEGSASLGEETDFSHTDFGDAALFHVVFRSFWKGHFSRCNFYAEKYSKLVTEINQVKRVIILFYHGIVSAHLLKHSNSSAKKQVARNALEHVKMSVKESKWNHANKVHLLEAELYSWERKTEKAKHAYNAAIESSRASKFIHEQGLACELAGLHYKGIAKYDTARDFFNQARDCYEEWGSQIKVDYIADQIDMLGGLPHQDCTG
mmetsp:Transcript_14825/g.35681  ORF Transcript_14825/g.35681 Transcript_14825/m.35681 type:complete len:1443 (+) Transcript_14825:88-4416(+)